MPVHLGRFSEELLKICFVAINIEEKCNSKGNLRILFN